MIRNLKTLGLAALAVLAVGAFAASPASAQINGGKFTSKGGSYPLTVHGQELDEAGVFNNELTFLGIPMTCDIATFKGSLSEPSRTLSLTPEYGNCHNPDKTLTFTVTTNSCSYLAHVGTGTGGSPVTDWHGSIDLKCPPGKRVEVHVYQAVAPDHSSPVCTLTIGETGNQNLPVTYTDGKKNSVIIEGTFDIAGTFEGACAPHGETPFVGNYHMKVTIEGRNGNNLHIGT